MAVLFFVKVSLGTLLVWVLKLRALSSFFYRFRAKGLNFSLLESRLTWHSCCIFKRGSMCRCSKIICVVCGTQFR
uniref:Putative secreted protein n=1 Tax=Ixodes ricinus TaxID=34613 RepID=A0A6B0UAU7_IXORI